MTDTTAGELLLDRVRALVPNLRARGQEVERLRRVPQESIDELTEAGVFKMSVPAEYGGYELDLATMNEVCAEIARGCCSTSWVVATTTAGTWVAGLYPEEATKDVFDSDGPCANLVISLRGLPTVSRADGGYRITGQWAFGTSSLHVRFFNLGVPYVDEDGTEDQLVVLLPADQVNVNDDWATTGLRGTGSNSFSVSDVFVPENRAMRISALLSEQYPSKAFRDRELYRAAYVPAFCALSSGTALGGARSALEYALQSIHKRGITYTHYQLQAEAPLTHLQLGEAKLKLASAQFHGDRALAAVQSKAATH